MPIAKLGNAAGSGEDDCRQKPRGTPGTGVMGGALERHSVALQTEDFSQKQNGPDDCLALQAACPRAEMAVVGNFRWRAAGDQQRAVAGNFEVCDQRMVA